MGGLKDAFLHQSELKGFRVGDYVEFAAFLNTKGEPRATDLRPTEAPAPVFMPVVPPMHVPVHVPAHVPAHVPVHVQPAAPASVSGPRPLPTFTFAGSAKKPRLF